MNISVISHYKNHHFILPIGEEKLSQIELDYFSNYNLSCFSEEFLRNTVENINSMNDKDILIIRNIQHKESLINLRKYLTKQIKEDINIYSSHINNFSNEYILILYRSQKNRKKFSYLKVLNKSIKLDISKPIKAYWKFDILFKEYNKEFSSEKTLVLNFFTDAANNLNLKIKKNSFSDILKITQTTKIDYNKFYKEKFTI